MASDIGIQHVARARDPRGRKLVGAFAARLARNPLCGLQKYANTSHGASIGCLHDERLALAVSHRAIRELGDPGRCKRSARALRAVENAVTSSRVCVRQSAGDAQAMKDMARPRVSSRLL